jgi:hypothetical protein
MVCCIFGVGQFEEETEGVSSKWNCILCDIMICVFWQALRDITEETAVAMNNVCHDDGLRNQHLEYHISWDCWYFQCMYGFGYCNVLVLAVLTDGRWKLAATYCNNIRCWHDGVDRRSTFCTLRNYRQENWKHQRDSGQQVSSLPDILPEVPAVCLLKIIVLSCHAQRSVDR